MRKFSPLKPERQMLLMRQFPNLMEVDACEEDYGYAKIAISYFDHWLSESEACAAFSNVSLEESLNRKNKQLGFCRRLLEATEVLNFKVFGRPNNRRVKFRAFCDNDVALRYCSEAYDKFSSRFFFKLVIPEYSALYYQGYDATNYIYCRGGEFSNRLRSLIYDSGLNVLD
ncbi:hypothetical protein ACJJIF_00750 [Microbulbifer sp. SSSA002]|uniref:hypothetical protein n=1 Tax=Microbulbifer sp. SSSA002 TaxID=3243376 RepID=UPI00403A5D16